MTAQDVLFVADPWDTLDHARDSTLHLASVGSAAHGLRSFWALPEGLFLQNGTLYARIEGEVVDGGLLPLAEIREFTSFHSIHWRADPPVTLSTFRLWSLLAAAASERGVPFVNAPHALLTWNEKFAPLRFREWAIQGVVSDSERVWKNYFDSMKPRGTRLVAKPTGDAASRGVQLLPANWDEASRALARLRDEFGPWLVIQEFEANLATEGETRIFTLGPEIVGTINKLPHPKHPIMNLDVAGAERPQLRVAEPTAEQRARASVIAAMLAREGVYLATIDFIGERVLEINVTSPGLIRWLDERLDTTKQVARRYWDGLLKA